MKRYIGIIPLFFVFLATLMLWIRPLIGLVVLWAAFPVWIVMVIWALVVVIGLSDSGECKNELSGKMKLWLAVVNLAFILSFFLIRVPWLLFL